MNIEKLRKEMLEQDNRSTAYPIFVVVEDKKIWGYSDHDDYDGKQRKEDIIAYDDLCESCLALWEDNKDLPDDCEEYQCGDSFNYYKIEKDVPNMRAAFFFTADSCDAHIKANPHHYNKTAKSYAISAYYNFELRAVMNYLAGKDLG